MNLEAESKYKSFDHSKGRKKAMRKLRNKVSINLSYTDRFIEFENKFKINSANPH
jgi:hypothetical protein